MSIGSGAPRPAINWLPLLSLWEKQLMNGREGKMVAKNAVDSIFNVNQTKGFMYITQKLRENMKSFFPKRIKYYS